MLKVWGRNTSSNVQKVIWALAEMKLPFERIDVGRHDGMVGHRGRPGDLDEALDVFDAADAERARAGARIRVSRGQLRGAAHPERRPRRRGHDLSG